MTKLLSTTYTRRPETVDAIYVSDETDIKDVFFWCMARTQSFNFDDFQKAPETIPSSGVAYTSSGELYIYLYGGLTKVTSGNYLLVTTEGILSIEQQEFESLFTELDPVILLAHNMDMSFEQKLKYLLNYMQLENESNTPDFVLAAYLHACLRNFNTAVQSRDNWWGSRTPHIDEEPLDLG